MSPSLILSSGAGVTVRPRKVRDEHLAGLKARPILAAVWYIQRTGYAGRSCRKLGFLCFEKSLAVFIIDFLEKAVGWTVKYQLTKENIFLQEDKEIY